MSKSSIINIEALGFPWRTRDPFLFTAHHRDIYPPGNENLGLNKEVLEGRNIGNDFTIKDGFRMYHGSEVPGFPYHPHRGFETITINKEGYVDHSDSLGAAGRFGEGDVQWMTAGNGVQHSEMFPLLNSEKENPLEIFQIWLNLPAKDKMVEAHFKMLWKEMIPQLVSIDNNAKETIVDVVAGSLNGINAPKPTPNSWAAKEEHGVMILTIKIEAGGTWTLPKSKFADANRTLYFYRGDHIEIEGSKIGEYHTIDLDPENDVEIYAGNKDAYFLFLQGKAIGEPVATYGPFVMNTQEEIQQTFRDFQRTQFGGWPWKERDHNHGKDKGRFALHADGKEEIK